MYSELLNPLTAKAPPQNYLSETPRFPGGKFNCKQKQKSIPQMTFKWQHVQVMRKPAPSSKCWCATFDATY